MLVQLSRNLVIFSKNIRHICHFVHFLEARISYGTFYHPWHGRIGKPILFPVKLFIFADFEGAPFASECMCKLYMSNYYRRYCSKVVLVYKPNQISEAPADLLRSPSFFGQSIHSCRVQLLASHDGKIPSWEWMGFTRAEGTSFQAQHLMQNGRRLKLKVLELWDAVAQQLIIFKTSSFLG